MSVVTEGQSIQSRPVAVMQVDRQRSSQVLQTWTLKGIPPGGRWRSSNSVPPPAGSDAMRLILSSQGSLLRVLRIVAISSNTA